MAMKYCFYLLWYEFLTMSWFFVALSSVSPLDGSRATRLLTWTPSCSRWDACAADIKLRLNWDRIMKCSSYCSHLYLLLIILLIWLLLVKLKENHIITCFVWWCNSTQVKPWNILCDFLSHTHTDTQTTHTSDSTHTAVRLLHCH